MEERLTIFKKVKSFIGIEPSYFLPLTAKSQDQITYLFIKNSNLNSTQIPFENFRNLIHLDLPNNEIEEIPNSISQLFKLQSLDLSNNKINDKTIQVISNLIQRSQEINLIDFTSIFFFLSSFFFFFFF